MEISDFKPGVTYRMTIVPYLDCEPGEETVKELTVLEPATEKNSLWDDGVDSGPPPPDVLAEWQKFLRVRDLKGATRLQWPALIVKAEPLDGDLPVAGRDD